MLLLSSRPGTALKLDIPIMRWHLRKSDFMRIMKTRKMAEEKVNFSPAFFHAALPWAIFVAWRSTGTLIADTVKQYPEEGSRGNAPCGVRGSAPHRPLFIS